MAFRISLALVFRALVAPRGYYTCKFPPPTQDTVVVGPIGRSTILAMTLAIAGLVSLLVYLAAPALVAWASIDLPDWLRWGGVALAARGFGLLQRSLNALGANWSDQPRITRDQVMVTWGSYRWIRHPILGSSLLIAANWFIGGAWIAMTLLFVVGRMRFEEDSMLERFGDSFVDYQKRSGSLIPWIWQGSPEKPNKAHLYRSRTDHTLFESNGEVSISRSITLALGSGW